MYSMRPTTAGACLGIMSPSAGENRNCSLMETHLSSVAAKMYFPFGENLTKDTGGLSSSDHKNKQKGPFYKFGQTRQHLFWTWVKAD